MTIEDMLADVISFPEFENMGGAEVCVDCDGIIQSCLIKDDCGLDTEVDHVGKHVGKTMSVGDKKTFMRLIRYVVDQKKEIKNVHIYTPTNELREVLTRPKKGSAQEVEFLVWPIKE